MKKYWQLFIWIGILGLLIAGIAMTLADNQAKQAELIQQSKKQSQFSDFIHSEKKSAPKPPSYGRVSGKSNA